jgi:TDG/mug DNA glycosylase family protein
MVRAELEKLSARTTSIEQISPGTGAREAVSLGLQRERVGEAAVFVLPNPSGRNANFSYAEMLAAFRALRRYVVR